MEWYHKTSCQKNIIASIVCDSVILNNILPHDETTTSKTYVNTFRHLKMRFQCIHPHKGVAKVFLLYHNASHTQFCACERSHQSSADCPSSLILQPTSCTFRFLSRRTSQRYNPWVGILRERSNDGRSVRVAETDPQSLKAEQNSDTIMVEGKLLVCFGIFKAHQGILCLKHHHVSCCTKLILLQKKMIRQS